MTMISIASAEQLAERIQPQREHISYIVVGSEDMEAFVPVVARLANA
jgi:hypothetical protein